MRICYIYREKEKNEHSIEYVFDTVASEMQKRGHDIHKWYKPVSWIKTFTDIRELRKQNFDIYHITGDVYYLWFFFPWSKTTMTVHDIGCWKNHSFRWVILLLVVMPIFLAAWFLKGITCVSDLTKGDLENMLHIRPNKLKTIFNPLSLPVKRCDKTFNTECPRILQIGTGDHKNLIGLIEAVKGLKCKIDIVGNPTNELIEKMKQYGEEYSISYRIPLEEVIRHYEECDILYFVSRSEGFGMPIIEAQTVGRPVLTTASEPTRTVAGGAALLYSDDDYTGIREGILRIINEDKLREQLIDAGFANAANYSPKAITGQYEDFYRNRIF